MNPPRPAVKAAGLRKSYGKHVVLGGVDLDHPAGTISLLGPNAAGKTNTVRIRTTFIHASSGDMSVAGHGVTHGPRTAIRVAKT